MVSTSSMPGQARCQCEGSGTAVPDEEGQESVTGSVCRGKRRRARSPPRSPAIRLGTGPRLGSGWWPRGCVAVAGGSAPGRGGGWRRSQPGGIPPRRLRCSVPAQPGSSAGREGTRACRGHGREQPDGELAPKPAGSAGRLKPDPARGHPLPRPGPGQHGHARRPCRPPRQRLHVHPVRHDALRRHRGQPHPGLHPLPQGGQAQRPLPRLHQEQGLHDLSLPHASALPGLGLTLLSTPRSLWDGTVLLAPKLLGTPKAAENPPKLLKTS